MSVKANFFKLSDGASIPFPAYGSGTKWYKRGRDEVDGNLVSALEKAIEAGFTHIDGAEAYNTDLEIGQAIKNSGVSRQELYITNKYFPGLMDSNVKQELNPRESLNAALKKLQIDYVDLYLLHSPFISKEFNGFSLVEAWKYLEGLLDDGLAKSIGVSNFSKKDLEEILNSKPKYKPVVNQIEFNAYLQNQTPDIVSYCQKNDILIAAYSPLGPIVKGSPGPLDPIIKDLAIKYKVTESQILLRWVVQNNILPVTTTSQEERMKSFLDIFDFELTDEEFKEIEKTGKEKLLRQYWVNQYKIYDN